MLLHDETRNFRLGCFALGAARGFNGFREVTLAPLASSAFEAGISLPF
jgi:hypothetical protein